jgi:hypothetical protein
MSDQLLIAIISSSLLSSLLTALLSPPAKWWIEKRRIRLDNRKSLIASVREFLNRDDFSRRSFRTSEIFGRISPHLSKELNESIRNESFVFIMKKEGGMSEMKADDVLKERVNKDLHRLEKEWD